MHASTDAPRATAAGGHVYQAMCLCCNDVLGYQTPFFYHLQHNSDVAAFLTITVLLNWRSMRHTEPPLAAMTPPLLAHCCCVSGCNSSWAAKWPLTSGAVMHNESEEHHSGCICTPNTQRVHAHLTRHSHALSVAQVQGGSCAASLAASCVDGRATSCNLGGDHCLLYFAPLAPLCAAPPRSANTQPLDATSLASLSQRPSQLHDRARSTCIVITSGVRGE